MVKRPAPGYLLYFGPLLFRLKLPSVTFVIAVRSSLFHNVLWFQKKVKTPPQKGRKLMKKAKNGIRIIFTLCAAISVLWGAPRTLAQSPAGMPTMHSETGETVRIFFGVGGPNLISSPHVIGQVLTQVYNEGSFTSPPLTFVQTTTVPPGGATIIEFKPLVPGSYKLVDHALVRVARSLIGSIEVSGPPNPELFHEGPVR
jgi:hypothetical protein